MKDEHLTLRLPAALARALTRRARDQGVPKSQLVRDAVQRYLDPAPTLPAPLRSSTETAARWALLPHLTPDDATRLAEDIASGLRALPPVRSPWD
jgi:hypothetical protein